MAKMWKAGASHNNTLYKAAVKRNWTPGHAFDPTLYNMRLWDTAAGQPSHAVTSLTDRFRQWMKAIASCKPSVPLCVFLLRVGDWTAFSPHLHQLCF